MTAADTPRRTQTVLAVVSYLLAAFLFTKIHFQSTRESPQASLVALASGTAHPSLQHRSLVPPLAEQLARVLPIGLQGAYGFIEFVAVALLLVGYRRFLAEFLERRTATIFAPLLLYPMLWNQVGLSTQYFPSEVPATLLFMWGLNCIRSRRTALLYVVVLLACLNRETSPVLALACIAARPKRETWARTLTTATGVVVVWVCVRAVLVQWSLADPPRLLDTAHVTRNLRFLGSVARFELHVRRYLLLFGGSWIAIPFMWRGLPQHVKWLSLLALPYGLAVFCTASLRHGGNFPELIPLLFAPALLWLREGMCTWGTKPRHCGGAFVHLATRSWHWLLVALLTSYCCVRVHERATVEFMDNTRATFASGTAPKPFQYRALVPFLADQLRCTWGTGLRASMNGMNTLFLCVLLFAFRAYIRPIVGRRPAYGLCFLILVPILFNYCGLNNLYYPADLASIALFVLGALCMRRGQWPAYYVVFVLATLNRETSCFLTFLLLLTQWPRGRKGVVVLHCAAQLAIWIALKAWLAWVFRDNPGAAVFENQLRGNWGNALRLLKLDPTALQYLLTFGLLWLTGRGLLCLVPVADAVSYRREDCQSATEAGIGNSETGCHPVLRCWPSSR